MHDVLKLYFGLRAKCLWRMIKELGLMVIPALLLFSLLWLQSNGNSARTPHDVPILISEKSICANYLFLTSLGALPVCFL